MEEAKLANKEKSNLLIACYEKDMRRRTALWYAVQKGLGWPFPKDDPLNLRAVMGTQWAVVEETDLEWEMATRDARQAAANEDEDEDDSDNCRQIRAFVGWKLSPFENVWWALPLAILCLVYSMSRRSWMLHIPIGRCTLVFYLTIYHVSEHSNRHCGLNRAASHIFLGVEDMLRLHSALGLKRKDTCNCCQDSRTLGSPVDLEGEQSLNFEEILSRWVRMVNVSTLDLEKSNRLRKEQGK